MSQVGAASPDPMFRGTGSAERGGNPDAKVVRSRGKGGESDESDFWALGWFFFLFSEMFNQLDTGIQYSGRHDKKYGDFFKTALNRARPGLHDIT